MDNCGYCAKAKEVLAPEIASGFVVLKNAKDATNANGFPHFVETTTGATHTGFMADKQKLFEKLGVKQNKEPYHNTQAHHNAHAQAHHNAHAQAHHNAHAQAHHNAQAHAHHNAQTQAHHNAQAHAHHNVQAHAHHNVQSKEQFENCSSVNGGYLSLGKTWSTQKRYVA